MAELVHTQRLFAATVLVQKPGVSTALRCVLGRNTLEHNDIVMQPVPLMELNPCPLVPLLLAAGDTITVTSPGRQAISLRGSEPSHGLPDGVELLVVPQG